MEIQDLLKPIGEGTIFDNITPSTVDRSTKDYLYSYTGKLLRVREFLLSNRATFNEKDLTEIDSHIINLTDAVNLMCSIIGDKEDESVTN